MKILSTTILFLLLGYASTTLAESAHLQLRALSGNIPIKSWKTLRDQRVVKQDLDYSCGAAAIATILSEYYQRPTTEKEVLEQILKVNGKKGAASFADMEKMLPALGFRGVGLATSWEQLVELKIPVITYVLHRKQDHFTVVSGIDSNRVRLSDSSLGNRTLTRSQFRAIWETRNEQGLEGKMLAILPLNPQSVSTDASFIQTPAMHRIAKERLLLR